MAKILYIDDSENNRILVERKLKRSGHEVLCAPEADTGLALAAQEKPDLVLMDLGLPGIDGWEATRRMKSDPKLRHIPVIALTAHAMAEEVDKARAAGCDEHETKPFDFERLLQKINRLLGQGEAR